MAIRGALVTSGDRRVGHPTQGAWAGPGAGRTALMLTTAVAAALALGAADPVHAQTNNACGPADASGHVVCTPAGNPYSDGIVYQAPVQDLTVAL